MHGYQRPFSPRAIRSPINSKPANAMHARKLQRISHSLPHASPPAPSLPRVEPLGARNLRFHEFTASQERRGVAMTVPSRKHHPVAGRPRPVASCSAAHQPLGLQPHHREVACCRAGSSPRQGSRWPARRWRCDSGNPRARRRVGVGTCLRARRLEAPRPGTARGCRSSPAAAAPVAAAAAAEVGPVSAGPGELAAEPWGWQAATTVGPTRRD